MSIIISVGTFGSTSMANAEKKDTAHLDLLRFLFVLFLEVWMEDSIVLQYCGLMLARKYNERVTDKGQAFV